MKKAVKLSLNRETLRQLETKDFQAAAGGATGLSVCVCPPPTHASC
jgi:hypothetical protein